MNLTNKQDIQSLLSKHNIHPKKSYGQNFLVDQKVLEDILAAAGFLSSSDVRSRYASDVGNRHACSLLEIGPGIGTLTVELLKYAKSVIAVEADRDMFRILQETTGSPSKLKIIPTTIQHFRRHEYLKDGEYKIVANLPYNVSSYVLNDYLQNSPKPSEIIVMLQKEVAERCIAKAGDSDRSLLSLVVELYSKKTEIIRTVPPSAFWPEPKVQSAILKIILDDNVETQNFVSLRQSILKTAKQAFSQRRKKLSNSLKNSDIIKLSGISADARPQDLTLQQWQNLTKKISEIKS